MLEQIHLPKMMSVRQEFDGSCIEDPVKEITEQFHSDWVLEALRGKRTVGITIGSRELNALPEMVKALCGELRALGIAPFLIPSMGSHGGADAVGQANVLSELGFDEERIGAEILSGVDVVKLGMTENGLDVYYDSKALSLDGVIVLGRVKAHTDITGRVESGLQKMIVVGLGDQYGASVMHARGLDMASPRIEDIATYAIENANVLFGIALVENAYDKTCAIQYVPRDMIQKREPELLAYSKTRLPRFLFNDIDVLVVDYIGKNISGDGMDPNVIGRGMIGVKNPDIHIDKIAVLALTPETMGAALGIGLADVTTERVYRRMNLETTYTNAITALAYRGAHIPLVMDSDINAVRCACYAARARRGLDVPLRIARIKNTLSLSKIAVSPSLYEEIKDIPGISASGEPEPLPFDENGNLIGN